VQPDNRRAERAAFIRDELVALWGDDMPPTGDPVQSILTDAVAVDDQRGVDAGLVVQGDGLSLRALATALAATDSTARWAALPVGLLSRIRALPEVGPGGSAG